MLKSGSQLCVRYGSEVEGVWRATRLNQRVIDDVKMRDCDNFTFPMDEVLFNIRFNISCVRCLFALFSQVSSVTYPDMLLLQLAENHRKSTALILTFFIEWGLIFYNVFFQTLLDCGCCPGCLAASGCPGSSDCLSSG